MYSHTWQLGRWKKMVPLIVWADISVSGLGPCKASIPLPQFTCIVKCQK
jgi:hypothetical protein